MSTFFAVVVGLSALGHAYLPAPQELLGLALDPSLDPLAVEQMQEEDIQPAEAPEPTWEEDAALWEAANDPLVLDGQIFDENGNWIDDEDTSVNFAEFVDQEQAPVEEVRKPTPVPAPVTVQTTTMAPSTTSNGKPVLYRGGKVFDPGTGFHAAAAEEPAQEPMEEAVIVEEETEVPSDTMDESGTGDTMIVEEDAMTGAVLDDTEALTATGALEDGEEAAADNMPVAEEEEESSWLSGTLMSVALAGGAIALGVVLLVFKGKSGGMRRKADATTPTAAATDVPAAPAPEESKLQQAIDEMRGKQ